MVSLAGLASVYPGFQEAKKLGVETDIRQATLDELGLERAAAAVAGRSLAALGIPGAGAVRMPPSGYFGGPQAQPGAQPQTPAPGQPSVPMTPGAPSLSGPQVASVGAPVGLGSGPSRDDPRNKTPVIMAAAQKYGIDPQVALRVARSEGLRDFLGDGGKSGGAFQLYTGGGLGNEFRRDTGLDPLDPRNEDATIDYAMMRASQGGWGPWYGAPKVGVGQWDGIRRGGGQGPMGMLGLQDAIQSIVQSNPGAPPELMFRALNKLAPLLRADDRQMLLYMEHFRKQQQGDERLGQGARRLEQGDERLGQGARRLEQTDEALAEKQRQALVREENEQRKMAQADERIQIQRDNLILKQEGAKPTLSSDAISDLAERWLSGDTKVAMGFGGSKQGSANRAAVLERAMDIARERGMSLEEQLNAITGMAGKQAASQTAGRISAYVDQAAVSFESLIPIVKNTFKEVQDSNLRTRFPTINSFLQAADERLGDPKIVALKASVQGLINEYAQVMNRGRGQTTRYSQQKAESVLNTAWNTGQFDAAVKVLQQETEAVRKASERLISKYKIPDSKPGAKATESAPAAPAAPAPATSDKFKGFEIVQ